MAEIITISLFIAGLLLCLIVGGNIVYALLFGMVCFTSYALYKKYAPREIVRMMVGGLSTYKNILTIFMIIGMLTAVWRCAGTIPYIIYNAVGFINPKYMALSAFLLCGLMSVLTGTSFGTASTMGVICMMVSNSLGVNPALSGGAILAGAFFGDRCSPMSTSAMLVSALTDTDIYKNIVNMIKTSILPLAAACVFYVAAGSGSTEGADVKATVALFEKGFDLSFVTALPALLVVVLLLARVKVKWAMLSSVLAACVVSVWIQGTEVIDVLKYIVFGYKVADPELGALVNGGGIVSMIRVSLIISISGTYSGIFKNTEILSGIKSVVRKLAALLTPFGATTVVSVFMAMISCNQTLATSITHQTCEEVIPDKYEMACALENTVIVISPLVPWSIAGAVPLQTIGAPTDSLLFAVYLYFLPVFNWAYSVFKAKFRKA